ncbi:MAG: ASCH domain-containing protein [Muribaculaceae bacterium]|nr:ASCH domain-containing protein [Muribaculaceae bacterium]
MKCLSVQQPWASLICSGVKDVENRSWIPKENPGRILINAGKVKRTAESLSLYYDVIICNAINNGFLPKYQDMPLGAIIGYADIIGFDENSDSIWAGDKTEHGSEWKWRLGEVGLFNEPIPSKGKLGLYDVEDINPDSLPEVINFPEMKREGKILYMPVSEEIFNKLDIDKLFFYYLTGNNIDIFCDEELNPIDTEKIIFIESKSGKLKEMEVIDSWVYQSGDDGEKPIIYYDPWGNELYQTSINFELK